VCSSFVVHEYVSRDTHDARVEVVKFSDADLHNEENNITITKAHAVHSN